MSAPKKQNSDAKTFIEKLANAMWFENKSINYFFIPFSICFRIVVYLRKLAYQLNFFQKQKLPIPVIVIGNLIVGGAGKTPTVIALVHLLRQSGFFPGVISRGHGAKSNNKFPNEIQASSDANLFGDEPVLIATRTSAPVFSSKNRFAAGKALLEKYPKVNILVSDDGLQHYQLHRDFEIIVFDHRLVGNGYMLPAGPLREPISRRYDAVILNDIDNFYIYKNNTNFFELKKKRVYASQLINFSKKTSLTTFVDLNVLALAGISAPEKFFNLLKKWGIKANTIKLSDHYNFTNYSFSDKQEDIILITEKDAVKCLSVEDPRIWVVCVDFGLDTSLIDLILKNLHGQKNSSNISLPNM